MYKIWPQNILKNYKEWKKNVKFNNYNDIFEHKRLEQK